MRAKAPKVRHRDARFRQDVSVSSRTPDAIFAKIARRYDLLNKVLSLGREQAWRRSVVDRLPSGRLLDLGSGTGAANEVFDGRDVVALDPVSEMLALSPIEERVVGLGERLPFDDESFDSVFSAYVFRNLDSVDETMAEIRRVLRTEGMVGILDLGRPLNSTLAAMHRMGSAVVLPLAGLTVGAREEYTYLHRSLDKLPHPEEMYTHRELVLDDVWRMGPLGFAYGAVLTKA
jgi:demethylmenaquinone methyltransferase/2-methoxy-6-polyprenyl-1,4-benzoquinol methylase